MKPPPNSSKPKEQPQAASLSSTTTHGRAEGCGLWLFRWIVALTSAQVAGCRNDGGAGSGCLRGRPAPHTHDTYNRLPPPKSLRSQRTLRMPLPNWILPSHGFRPPLRRYGTSRCQPLVTWSPARWRPTSVRTFPPFSNQTPSSLARCSPKQASTLPSVDSWRTRGSLRNLQRWHTMPQC